MSIDRLSNELARYTYKPGWGLSIEVDAATRLPELVVEFVAPDSRDPAGKEIVIRSGQRAPIDLYGPCWPGTDEQWRDAFHRWLTDALARLEEHEAQEWFRYDGELVTDPHAGGRFAL